MSDKDERLPKSLVLKKRLETREIFEKGEFERRKHVFIYKLPSSTDKIGFFVNKRCGNAVARNKIKRWLREVYRRNKEMFDGYKVIIYVKKPLSYNYTYHDLHLDITGEPAK